jgi:hypothetical protein
MATDLSVEPSLTRASRAGHIEAESRTRAASGA